MESLVGVEKEKRAHTNLQQTQKKASEKFWENVSQQDFETTTSYSLESSKHNDIETNIPRKMNGDNINKRQIESNEILGRLNRFDGSLTEEQNQKRLKYENNFMNKCQILDNGNITKESRKILNNSELNMDARDFNRNRDYDEFSNFASIGVNQTLCGDGGDKSGKDFNETKENGQLKYMGMTEEDFSVKRPMFTPLQDYPMSPNSRSAQNSPKTRRGRKLSITRKPDSLKSMYTNANISVVSFGENAKLTNSEGSQNTLIAGQLEQVFHGMGAIENLESQFASGMSDSIVDQNSTSTGGNYYRSKNNETDLCNKQNKRMLAEMNQNPCSFAKFEGSNSRSDGTDKDICGLMANFSAHLNGKGTVENGFDRYCADTMQHYSNGFDMNDIRAGSIKAESEGLNSSGEEKILGGYLNEQQYKMLQSVKMVQQTPIKLQNDYIKNFTPSMTSSSLSSNSMNDSAINGLDNFMRNGDFKSENMKIGENINRSYFVRKCADELLKIKPRYQMALQNLANNGMEEFKVISQTVRLYSQILCNWRKQTLYIYSKMSASISALHRAMENEAGRQSLVATNYRTNRAATFKCNEQLEANMNPSQNDFKILHQRGQEVGAVNTDGGIVVEKLRGELAEKENIIRNYKGEMEDLRTLYNQLVEENEILKKKKEREAVNASTCKEKNLNISINSVKDLIEKIIMIKNHQNILCLNDAKNLDSSITKPDITIICEKLKYFCNELSKGLENDNLIENYLSRKEKNKKKSPKDSIEIEKIIDRRMSPEGKIQFYVSCPFSQFSLAKSPPKSSSVIEDSNLSNFGEKVWVDEENLVGCEAMIRSFYSSRQQTGNDMFNV